MQTGVCNYAAFAQPLQTSVEVGDQMAITIWHDRLDAAEPASAHVAVWLDRTVVWETEVAIPRPSGTFEILIPIEDDHARGTDLGIHLHNHGFNSWRFIDAAE